MSSTQGDRNVFDDYPTPPWAVDRLLDRVWIPRGRILEPCAGAGQIISTLQARMPGSTFTAIELRKKYADSLAGLTPHYDIRDFFSVFEHTTDQPFDAVVTNPPYELAFPFLKRCRELAPWVCMLLRVGFLEGGAGDSTIERRRYLDRDMPDLRVLPNRPPFSKNKAGKWATDSATYAWFVWGPQKRARGEITVLDLTPKETRKAWLQHLDERLAA